MCTRPLRVNLTPTHTSEPMSEKIDSSISSSVSLFHRDISAPPSFNSETGDAMALAYEPPIIMSRISKVIKLWKVENT